MYVSLKNVECSDWDDDKDFQNEIAYRAMNLESLAAPRPVIKVGDNPGIEVRGNIEKVPKTILHRGAQDPFRFAKKRTCVQVEVRDLSL